jgi:hypothetical protein
MRLARFATPKVGIALVSVLGCASKPPIAPAVIDPEMVLVGDRGVRDLVSAPAAIVDEIARSRAAGDVVFVAEDGRPVSTPGCVAHARYRWEARADTRGIDFHGASDSERRPLAPDNAFADELRNGHVIRVRVITSGRWVLDDDVTVPEACGHVRYAAEITVGAYAAAWLADILPMPKTAVGRSTAEEERPLPMLSRGDLDRCARPGDGPPEGCAVPIEILAPRAEGAIHVRAPGRAPAASPACVRRVALSSDLSKDVAAIGQSCGANEGFAPVATAFERRLSEREGWQPQYEIAVEEGHCYRLMVVGGRGIAAISAALRGANDAWLAIDQDSGGVAVVGGRDPFCPTESQRVTAVVRVVRGDGDYAVWLWKK